MLAAMYYNDLVFIFLLFMDFYTQLISTKEVENAFSITHPPTRSSVLHRFLSAHKVSSRLQCLHRCQLSQSCEDAVMVVDGECWLLSEDQSGANVVENNREEINELLILHKLPGLKLYLICVTT